MKKGPSSWDESFVKRLLAAPDFRTFLLPFFRVKGSPSIYSNPRPISYAEFSRRAGISSRSYGRDVLEGRKSLSHGGIQRISRGLNLTGPWKEYFSTLVLLSKEPSENPSLRRKLEGLRKQLWKSQGMKRVGNEDPVKPVSRGLQARIPAVYAACGTESEGVSIAEVVARTRMTPAQVGKALETLVKIEWIEKKGERYFPRHAHLALEKLGGDAFFREDYHRGLVTAAQRERKQGSHGENLFFSSTVCVRASRLRGHADRLRELLYAFINEIEDPHGDCVADLVLGLTDNRGGD